MSALALSLHFLQAQPDSRLIALAREGHEPAFEALVRRYHKELLGYCRRLQPRTGSAEDALQQTLLQAWRALRAGAEVREARPWLYRIAHNVSLNHLRVAVAVPQELPQEAGGHEVHQLVEQRLQARAALAGMAALPALQRDVFVSTTLDGASHEEVASALGLSSGAVRGLIYRARATLRSAAAGLIPNPAVHWAIRRAESRTGPANRISEALAGGGGAGVAAAIAKGGAVLTLAGAVAGAGGAIFSDPSSHHRRHEARAAGPSTRAQTHFLFASGNPSAAELATASAPRGAATGNRAQNRLNRPGDDHRGSSAGSTREDGSRFRDGSGGGSSTSSSGAPDGGSPGGATTATSKDGSSGSDSDGSSGGPGGGSSASSASSTSTTSGSGGGTSGGGPGPSSGTQLTSAQMTSDGGSGSDGGPVSSSGPGETTTTGP